MHDDAIKQNESELGTCKYEFKDKAKQSIHFFCLFVHFIALAITQNVISQEAITQFPWGFTK